MRKSKVKGLIFDVWQDHPDWSPKEIQSAVHDKLGTKRSKDGQFPGLRLVQQYVAEFKANLGQVVDEDRPWSIGASAEHKLSPEASRDLFEMWRFSLAMDRPLSIRQAKWIAYLRGLYREPAVGLPIDDYTKKVTRTLWLIRQSWLYSILERASRVMGEKHFETTDLDAASFMEPWEHSAAVKLGKVSKLKYSQEALAKLEQHGTSLTSPPHSIESVEQAVWHAVSAEPPRGRELDDFDLGEPALLGVYDLVCAYWLRHLSKGPLWNDLPETHWVREHWKKRGELRNRVGPVPFSGGSPNDSMYSRQLRIRLKVREWARTDRVRRRSLNPPIIRSFIEQHAEITRTLLPGQVTPPFNGTLLKRVGYEVTDEEMALWLKLHEQELRVQHPGFGIVSSDVRDRFIRDEESPDDTASLKRADIEQKAIQEKRQKQREDEFIGLVQQKGSVLTDKGQEAFWTLIRDELIKRHPEIIENDPRVKMGVWYPQWEEVEKEYKKLLEERKAKQATKKGGQQ